MVFFSSGAFFVSVSTLLVVLLFSFIYRIFERNNSRSKSESIDDYEAEFCSDSRKVDIVHRVETNLNTTESMETEKEECKEEDSPKLVFKFPSYKEFLQSSKGHVEFILEGEFLDDKGIDDSGGRQEVLIPGGKLDEGFSLASELVRGNLEAKVVEEDLPCSLGVGICEDRQSGKLEAEAAMDTACVESGSKRVVLGTEKTMVSHREEFIDEEQFSLEKDVSTFGAEKKKASDPEEFVEEERFSLEKDVSTFGAEKKMASDPEEAVEEERFSLEKDVSTFGAEKKRASDPEEFVEKERFSLENDVSTFGAEKKRASDPEEFVEKEWFSTDKYVSTFGAEKKMVSDQEVSQEKQPSSEKDVSTIDSDSESIVSSLEFSIISHFIDSYSDEFSSFNDFDSEFELSSPVETLGSKENLSLEDDLDLEEMNLQHSSDWHSNHHFEEEDDDILMELKDLEEAVKRDNSHPKNEKSGKEGESSSKPSDVTDMTLKQSSHFSSEFDSEDPNVLETLWEHQEFIEQLKMDIKKGRAYGLPTIDEEEEPKPFKVIEELRPWKIDEKFHHEDKMHELFKFYKSYRDKMRKFDILNFQKLYAIGFLQKKDPVESISICKASPSPAITSLLLDNFRICRPKKSQVDPMAKAIREWRSDLEAVYVGQLCLSWEFLHWQYEKALELWDADPYGVRLYNEVAGKFQQFQVLVQRFLETEPFEEGSRVQLYIKNRCVMRSFLQIPVVKEDTLKDIKKAIKEGKGNAITGDILLEIMEESIRIFWQFVRADKDANHSTLGRRRARVELQDPADSQLLLEIKDNLEKKEKRLKDIMRSGNCILRKLQKHHDNGSDQVLCFFSQVDMKLVRRVLNMSRLNTEQLMWCGDKLGRISFIGRKIHVDPSFMLFPC